jgi:hypothetical protein
MLIPRGIQTWFNHRFAASRSLPAQLLLGLLAGTVIYLFIWIAHLSSATLREHVILFSTVAATSMIVLPLCLRVEQINSVSGRRAAYVVIVVVIAAAAVIVVDISR